MKKQNKKNNTINLTKVAHQNIEEIDGIIKTLSVFDLINACDDIRANGISTYDLDTDTDKVIPLDMDAIHTVTGTPDCASLESVCADWFAKFLGGVKNCQAYKDFVYWYNTHREIFIDNRDSGRDTIIAWEDIKYMALRDTVNSMCEALMDKYKEDMAETGNAKN
jgi:hypothetical protein